MKGYSDIFFETKFSITYTFHVQANQNFHIFRMIFKKDSLVMTNEIIDRVKIYLPLKQNFL